MRETLTTKLAQANSVAFQKIARVEEELAKLPPYITPGQIFLFDGSKLVEWAVISVHPDDDQLWFTVPFDQNSLVGVTDVEVLPEALCGPGVLHCGTGIWIHTDDFVLDKRSGVLEADFVSQARDRIRELVCGSLSPSVEQLEVDQLLDYERRFDEVSEEADQLERRLQVEQ